MRPRTLASASKADPHGTMTCQAQAAQADHAHRVTETISAARLLGPKGSRADQKDEVLKAADQRGAALAGAHRRDAVLALAVPVDLASEGQVVPIADRQTDLLMDRHRQANHRPNDSIAEFPVRRATKCRGSMLAARSCPTPCLNVSLIHCWNSPAPR